MKEGEVRAMVGGVGQRHSTGAAGVTGDVMEGAAGKGSNIILDEVMAMGAMRSKMNT